MKSLVLIIGLLLAVVPAASAAANQRVARIVLFLPEEADPPTNYEPRLQSLGLYAERFLAKWMKHWGHPPERSSIFARDGEGALEVVVVRAKLSGVQGRAALPEIREKAVRLASERLTILPGEEVVWWVLYAYPGVKGFQGGARGFGGLAVNAYPPGEDSIPLDSELAAPALAGMSLKGTIHEFGHALGLPHIGPRAKRKLGNSLMGPINRAYWSRVEGEEPRVYLTEASAALLARHPIFRKESVPRPKMPQDVEVAELRVEEGKKGARVTVRGSMKASVPAHRAVVLDSEGGRFGDYWARTYVGTIDPKNGTFEVVVEEPFPSGVLFLGFCFANGVNSADGKMPFQRGSPLAIPYQTRDGRRIFDREQVGGGK